MIKYSCVYVNCENESMLFYETNFNFLFYKYVKLMNDEEWWILLNNEKEHTGLILIKNKTLHCNSNTIILNTNDSLQVYCKLKKKEIKNLSKPVYSNIGLSFNFNDPADNTIVVLEERVYSEL